MSFFAGMGFSAMSNPPIVTFPLLGGTKPVSIRMVGDLPAPFGPRKPSTSPRSTEKETPSTARLAPNILVKFSTLIIASVVSYNVKPDSKDYRGQTVNQTFVFF